MYARGNITEQYGSFGLTNNSKKAKGLTLISLVCS